MLFDVPEDGVYEMLVIEEEKMRKAWQSQLES